MKPKSHKNALLHYPLQRRRMSIMGSQTTDKLTVFQKFVQDTLKEVP